MKSRIVAAGVAALAVASIGVPAALSGSASASSTALPTVTACTPATATIGKPVTIHGTGLANATTVNIGTTKKNTISVTSFSKDSKKSIKFKAPAGLGKGGSENVTVTTANGTSTAVSCTFQKAPKK